MSKRIEATPEPDALPRPKGEVSICRSSGARVSKTESGAGPSAKLPDLPKRKAPEPAPNGRKGRGISVPLASFQTPLAGRASPALEVD